MKPHLLLVAFFICINLHAQDKPGIPADSVSTSSAIDMRLYRANTSDKAFFATEVSKHHLQSINGLTLYELLQGKISGLDIISASGGQSKNSTAQLRGNLNYTGNTPLIVIDGIPQKPLSNNPFFSATDVLQNFLPLSPEDILSIEILKNDPSVLLYGADGVNGVIYIETKKGIRHKPVFTYQLNQGFIPEPTFHKLLNGDQYSMYQLEALHNRYGVIEPPPEIAYDRDFSGFYNYSQNTDWVKAITQPANSSNHFLNVSGGNEKNLYYGSLNYKNVKGSIINTGYQQLLNRLHFEHNFSKIFTVGADFHYALYDYNDNISINGNDILEMAHIKAPNMSIWEYDSMGNKTGEYFNPINSYQRPGSTYYNPVSVATLAEKNGRKNQVGGDLIFNINITKWLTFRETLSYRFDRVKQKSYLPFNSMGFDWVELDYIFTESSDVQESFFNTESHLSFRAPFAGNSNHAITGAITWITNSGGGEWRDLQSNKNPSIVIYDPSINGQINHADEYSWKSRNNAPVVNLSYKFKDRYLVTGMLRRDAFSFDSEYGNLFKGISAGWRFSDESWFNKSDFLNSGIIMAGVSSSEYIYDVKIRSTPSYNVGIHLDVLNRIHVDWTYSGRNTESTHFLTGTFKTKNQGWDANIELEALSQEDINWFLYFNVAHYRCIYTDVPENINNNESATLSNGRFPHYLLKNRSPRSIYGLHYEGVYATDEDAYARDEYGNIIYNEGIAVPVIFGNYSFQGGDANYRDINYDGVINESDILYLGNSDPKYTGGFGSVIKYRSFSLNVNFHFRLGQKIILQEAINSDGLVTKNNKSERVLNRWRKPGDQKSGMTPRAYLDHPANFIGSDLYVESGSYVRMNHISLEYSLKPELCRKIHLSELSFILSAQRLFTYTQSRALDPEVDGIDNIRLYPPKVYTFSVRLGI